MGLGDTESFWATYKDITRNVRKGWVWYSDVKPKNENPQHELVSHFGEI